MSNRGIRSQRYFDRSATVPSRNPSYAIPHTGRCARVASAAPGRCTRGAAVRFGGVQPLSLPRPGDLVMAGLGWLEQGHARSVTTAAAQSSQGSLAEGLACRVCFTLLVNQGAWQGAPPPPPPPPPPSPDITHSSSHTPHTYTRHHKMIMITKF